MLTLFLFATADIASAGEAKLDENEEVQWVMGDLSALKTAVQAYYNDSSSQAVPSLASVLDYFEPLSLPPNAQTLYALRGDGQGWYVGYRSTGLKSETYSLLQNNANTLGLLGDDLRTPWRYGSAWIWTLALIPAAQNSERGAETTVIVERNSDAADAAMLILATATLISIVADRDCYYYYVPGHDWYWRSALVYRPVHYGRFFGHYGRPYPGPPRPFPQPRYRYRTPRAGWLSPTWRNSIGHAPGRNPRYDNGGPAYRRGADPRLAPPHTGRLRPRDPHFRNGPPQQRQPEPGSAGGRGPSREVRRPPQQYRPDASRSPEVRRPPQQRQPGPGRQGGGGPSREVRRPPQQRQPGPGRQGGGGPSREVRRPPQQSRPDASRSSEARRPPQQRPERGARDRNPSGNMPPKERTR